MRPQQFFIRLSELSKTGYSEMICVIAKKEIAQ